MRQWCSLGRMKASYLVLARLKKCIAAALVMYDRQSESWWLQSTGEGVVGKYR